MYQIVCKYEHIIPIAFLPVHENQLFIAFSHCFVNSSILQRPIDLSACLGSSRSCPKGNGPQTNSYRHTPRDQTSSGIPGRPSLGCGYTIWLVVSTPLKNISQIGSSSQLLGKITNVPNHQPATIYLDIGNIW